MTWWLLNMLQTVLAYLGTVTVRFEARMPMGERFTGRATIEGRERRKLFVNATLSLAATGAELANASTITIAAQSA
jgi:hypothetical protein